MSTMEAFDDLGPPIAAQEADHRIANSLARISALVRLEARTVRLAVTPSDVRGLLEGVAARIESVAKLHRLLASVMDADNISAAAHLREVAEMTRATCDPEDRLSIRYELDSGLRLPAARVEALSLILHEALVNTIKYAHPSGVHGRVVVRCGGMGASGALLTVEDDGVGLPEGMDPQTGGGIGFRIMRSLSAQIGATLRVRPCDCGLAVQVYLAA